MTTTTYKGYELQVTGSNSGTWGDTLNSDVIQRIDSNLGEVVTKSLTSADATLSAAESRAAIVRVTGTLTIARTVTTSCRGFFFFDNDTAGAYTVTVTNGIAGTTVPRGRRVPLISDATGVFIAATEEFTGGTTMLFVQTSAPTGWTKSTSHNDKALRVVSGTASTGGSTAFTTVFAARTIDRANLPNVTLTAASNGAHTHTWGVSNPLNAIGGGSASAAGGSTTYSTSSDGAHTHTTDSINGGVTQTTIDFAVQYVDVIIASRDSY